MPSLTRRTILIGLPVVAVAAAGGYALMKEDVGSSTYFAQDGIALRGADPVAYFTQEKAVIGSTEHAFDWRGVTWHFASAENRARFEEDPTAYAPQYGGYCAWAVAAKQKLYSIQPENWTVLDGKLYLNYSDGVQAKWNEDRPGFIAKADSVWDEVRKMLG